MNAPMVNVCPECRGAGGWSVDLPYPVRLRDGSRTQLGWHTCEGCAGSGELVVRCVDPACDKPATVKPTNGDPVCAYHLDHHDCGGLLIGPSFVWCPACDRCGLCSEQPVETDDGHCARCARDLAVVASGRAA